MPPQEPNNQYDFFLNQQQQPKPGLLGRATTLKQRVVIVVSGVVVLIIVAIVIGSLLSSGSSTTNLLTLAQQQNELVRVSTEALNEASQQVTKNLAINEELVLTTDQQQLLSYMKNHSNSVSSSQLSSTKDVSTDQQLQDAVSASNLDSVYIQITQTQLSNYTQAIKSVYESSTNSSEKQLLNSEYKDATTLSTQASSASQNLQNQ